MGRGRRPEAELRVLRARIETLMLQGLRAPDIHRALTGKETPDPITLSARQVRAHMAAVERAWVIRAGSASLEADRAAAVARLDDVMRTAIGRSTLNARSNLGVAYLNSFLKAHEQWIRLRGIDPPARQELSGPGGTPVGLTADLADHPAEHLAPREEARRLRQLAADREAEADAAEEA